MPLLDKKTIRRLLVAAVPAAIALLGGGAAYKALTHNGDDVRGDKIAPGVQVGDNVHGDNVHGDKIAPGIQVGDNVSGDKVTPVQIGKIQIGDEVKGDQYNIGQVVVPPAAASAKDPEPSVPEAKREPKRTRAELKLRVAPSPSPPPATPQPSPEPAVSATPAKPSVSKDRVLVFTLGERKPSGRVFNESITESVQPRDAVSLGADVKVETSVGATLTTVSGTGTAGNVNVETASVLEPNCGSASLDSASGEVSYTKPEPPHGALVCTVKVTRPGEPDRTWQIPVDAEP